MDPKLNPDRKAGPPAPPNDPAQKSAGLLEAGVGMMAFVMLVGVATYEISDMRARAPKIERAQMAAPVAKTPARPLVSISLRVEAAPRPQVPAASALALEAAAAGAARPLAQTPVSLTAVPAAKPPAAVAAKAEPFAPEASEPQEANVQPVAPVASELVAEAKIPPWPYASPDDADEPQEANAQPSAPEASEPVAEAKIPPWPYASSEDASEPQEANVQPVAPEASELVAEAKIPPWPYAAPDEAAEPQEADAQPAAAKTAELVAEAKTPSVDPMATGTIPSRAGRHAAARTLRAKPGHGARVRHLAHCRTHSCDIPSTKSTLPRVSSNP